jgi:phytoene dehydrogenase-like protein
MAMTQSPDSASTDVLVVGGGHNGLVAAAVAARAGLRVIVVEERPVFGGAVRTEKPFARAPGLSASTGAYLLGLMPPELAGELGLSIPLIKRDPHYFLPTTESGRYLLLGSNEEKNRTAFTRFSSDRDFRAHVALQEELAVLREDVAPTWLREPASIEETAEQYVRPHLRSTFIDLCRKPVRDYLARFGFESELMLAMYAVTDAFTGLAGTWDTPGSGMNFLVHNMCRLPGSDGTWMMVRGGMGAVTDALARAARESGAHLASNSPVAKLLVESDAATGAVLSDGRAIRARAVIVNADPFRMRRLVGEVALPPEYNARLDAYRRPGTTLKVNLALSDLPRFTCLPEEVGQHGTTIHLLPETNVMASLAGAFGDAMAGKLPDLPAIEWYVHTALDRSLQDAAGLHSAALFVQWVPYDVAGSSWEKEEDRYVRHLLAICDRFAPGTSDLVVDRFVLHPKRIEEHFGISYGHIHHVDNSFGFADRLPVATPIAGLYSASAACHPAGSVIGAAGYIAAKRVLRDLGVF